MTNKELIALIDAKIAGQGSAVDMGGALAPLLRAAIGVVVEDITAIPGDVLDALVCGGKVIKMTGKQCHLYNVSYKGEGVGEGLCLTYVDASTVETVSYDYTADGWAYNSTDKTTLTPDA